MKLIEDSAFRSFYAILDAVFIAVFSLISLWNFHPLLLALTIFVSLFIVVIPNLKPLKNYIQKSVKQSSQENENFIANVTDILNGFDEFFSYNMQQRMINQIGDSSRRINKAIMQNTKRQNRVTTLVLVINIISQLSVNLCTGVLIILGAVSAGSILSVGQFAGNIFNSLGSISGYLVSMNSTKSLFEKMKNIETSKDSGAAIAPIREISLEHVNYNYGNGSVFCRDIQMNFQAGGNYAVVGESGSGKSTLMNILAGKLLGYNGSIRIDGKELKELSGCSLREQVILINQKPYLFNTTIRDNILMGKEIDKGKLDRILETSDLASVIQNLPEGLDTPVIGNGSNLSG